MIDDLDVAFLCSAWQNLSGPSEALNIIEHTAAEGLTRWQFVGHTVIPGTCSSLKAMGASESVPVPTLFGGPSPVKSLWQREGRRVALCFLDVMWHYVF